MKAVLFLTFLAAFVAIGTGIMCYDCSNCYDVSNMNATHCDKSHSHCETEYWNGTGVVTKVVRKCTGPEKNGCLESTKGNETSIKCICDKDGCNNMTFPSPPIMATTTAAPITEITTTSGFKRLSATALSTIAAFAVTCIFAAVF